MFVIAVVLVIAGCIAVQGAYVRAKAAVVETATAEPGWCWSLRICKSFSLSNLMFFNDL